MKRASNRLRNRSPDQFIALETFERTRRSNRLRNRSPDHVIDLETFERTRRQAKRQQRQRQAATATTTTTPTTNKKQEKKIQSKQSKGKKLDTGTKNQQKAEASSSKSNKPSDERESKEQVNRPVPTMSASKSANTSTSSKDDLNVTEYVASPECYFPGEQSEAISTGEPQFKVSEEKNPSKLIITKKRSQAELEEPKDIEASFSASSSTTKQQSSQKPERVSDVIDKDKGKRFLKRIRTKKEQDVTTEHNNLSSDMSKTDDDIKSQDPHFEESGEEVKHKQDEQDEQKDVSEGKQ